MGLSSPWSVPGSRNKFHSGEEAALGHAFDPKLVDFMEQGGAIGDRFLCQINGTRISSLRFIYFAIYNSTFSGYRRAE